MSFQVRLPFAPSLHQPYIYYIIDHGGIDTELKNQIQAWIKERRAKGAVKNDSDGEAMDLDS